MIIKIKLKMHLKDTKRKIVIAEKILSGNMKAVTRNAKKVVIESLRAVEFSENSSSKLLNRVSSRFSL